MRVWKLSYGFDGYWGSFAHKVGCMCGNGEQHHHPWGIDLPPTHVQDSRGDIYPYNERFNYMGRYMEGWKGRRGGQEQNWKEFDEAAVWTVTHDPEKDIQIEWVVHNEDMECIAVCPSKEAAELIAGLLNGRPTMLPR